MRVGGFRRARDINNLSGSKVAIQRTFNAKSGETRNLYCSEMQAESASYLYLVQILAVRIELDG